MSRIPAFVAAAGLAVFAASALGQTGTTLDVRAAMQQRINPAVLAVWDVTNDAMDDEGSIDPAQMDGDKWDAVAEAAAALATAGRDMAAAGTLLAAARDVEVGEGERPMAEIQHYLDADPEGFRVFAAELADHADRLSAAARARDVAATTELVAGLDSACETCHARYWYPE